MIAKCSSQIQMKAKLHNQDITMCSWDLQSVDVIMSLMQNMDRKMQSLQVLLSAVATTRILNPVFGLL